jgi:hypothetical protein
MGGLFWMLSRQGLGYHAAVQAFACCTPQLQRIGYCSLRFYDSGWCSNQLHGADAFLRSRQLCSFLAYYKTRRFIIVFTRALHWSLSRARPIKSTPSHPVSLKIHFLYQHYAGIYLYLRYILNTLRDILGADSTPVFRGLVLANVTTFRFRNSWLSMKSILLLTNQMSRS